MRRQLVLVAAVLTVVLAGGYWVGWQSPLLRVTTVSVSVVAPETGPTGATPRRWRDETLRDRVSAALPSLTGRPLVLVDGDALARRLMDVRGVKYADVRRGWPHTIGVVVTPRVPVAVYQVPGAEAPVWQLVDADAAVVAQVPSPPKGWVVLRVAPNTAGGVAAMAAWGEFPDWLRRQVRVMGSGRTGSAATVELTLRSGGVVRWGAVGQSARKAEVLRALLRYPAKIYDVSAPELPTTRR